MANRGDLVFLDRFVSALQPRGVISTGKVGSVLINGYGNDVDLLVHSYRPFELIEMLQQYGYLENGNNYPKAGGFRSFKLKQFNVILIPNIIEFKKFKMAAALCAFLRTGMDHDMDKNTRINIHEFIRNWRDDE